MNKVQAVSVAIGFVTGFVFKLFEILAGASAHDVTKDWREWLVTVVFACLSGGAAFVLARWTPNGETGSNTGAKVA